MIAPGIVRSRHTLRFSVCLLAAIGAWTSVPGLIHGAAPKDKDQMNYFIYIGTYGKGVYGFRWNAATEALEPMGLAGEVTNPSFLATDSGFKHLYAVSELDGKVNGAVAAFAIDRTTGSLRPLNSVGSGGEAPCYLAVDRTGKTLVVANYMTGSLSAFPIGHDGRIGFLSALMTDQGSSVNKERQEGPHAHEAVISPDNQRVYVPDLGLDKIRIYRLDAAHSKLVPNDPPFVTESPGSGPRHIVFNKSGSYAYVINELKPLINVFAVDASNGNLNPVQSMATLPADFTKENTGAEIRLHPSGKFLYSSNRGHDSIQVFSVEATTGKLTMVQAISSGGRGPRGFDLSPEGDFLVAGNQKSDNLIVFKVNKNTGELSSSGPPISVRSPVDLLFVPIP